MSSQLQIYLLCCCTQAIHTVSLLKLHFIFHPDHEGHLFLLKQDECQQEA